MCRSVIIIVFLMWLSSTSKIHVLCWGSGVKGAAGQLDIGRGRQQSHNALTKPELVYYPTVFTSAFYLFRSVLINIGTVHITHEVANCFDIPYKQHARHTFIFILGVCNANSSFTIVDRPA